MVDEIIVKALEQALDKALQESLEKGAELEFARKKLDRLQDIVTEIGYNRARIDADVSSLNKVLGETL